MIVDCVDTNGAAIHAGFGISKGGDQQCTKDNNRGHSIANNQQYRRFPWGGTTNCVPHMGLKLSRLQALFAYSVLDDEIEIGLGAEFRGTRRTSLEMRPPFGTFDFSREISINDLLVVTTVHNLAFAFMYRVSRFAKSSLTSMRARESRDITVPIGMFRISAISLQEKPSTANRMRTVR